MATDQDCQSKYTRMENVLQKINNKYISLPDEDTKRNSKILDNVIQQLIEQMKAKDVLFKKMYEKIFFGGSYYDNLKVGKPEEYDLDFVLNFPVIANPVVEVSDKPGFVNVLINKFENIANPSLNEKKSSKFETLLLDFEDSKYLSTSQVLRWFERVVNQSLKEFNEVKDEGHLFKVKLDSDKEFNVYGTVSKAHPAFTLKLKCEEFNLDIDLVPCFQFTDDDWPKESYKPNPFPTKNKFLVVPKSPYCKNEEQKLDGIEKYWRLSFQEQERVIIKGDKFNTMKTVIRLLKKLRDHNKHKIASYYIKTMFLWEVQEREIDFWSQPMSTVFMEMLKKYEALLRKKNIPYYWNEQYNLIEHLKDSTVCDIANFLKRLINNINRKIEEDPFIIANFVLSEEEVNALKKEVDIGKKNKKLLNTQSSTTADVVADNNDERFKIIMDSIDALNKKMDLIIDRQGYIENKISRIDEKVENIRKKVIGPHDFDGKLHFDPSNNGEFFKQLFFS